MKKLITILTLALFSNYLFASSEIVASSFYNKVLTSTDGQNQIIFKKDGNVSLTGVMFEENCENSNVKEFTGTFTLENGWKPEFKTIIFNVEACAIEMGGTAATNDDDTMKIIFSSAEGAIKFVE